jgi:hypothetical protein
MIPSTRSKSIRARSRWVLGVAFVVLVALAVGASSATAAPRKTALGVMERST